MREGERGEEGRWWTDDRYAEEEESYGCAGCFCHHDSIHIFTDVILAFYTKEKQTIITTMIRRKGYRNWKNRYHKLDYNKNSLFLFFCPMIIEDIAVAFTLHQVEKHILLQTN